MTSEGKPPRAPSDRQLSPLWIALASDVPFKVFLAALALLQVPYLLPGVSRGHLAEYSTYFVSLLILPMVMLALLYRVGALAGRRERQFWRLLTLAYGFWWLVTAIHAFLPARTLGISADVATDSLYALFYLTWFLAAEAQPHSPSGRAFRNVLVSLESIGAMILVFGLLVYFVLIPSTVTEEIYTSWLPSLYLFVALDVLLTLRLAVLARAASGRRWRTVYGLLSLTFLLWAGLDAAECLTYAGVLDWQPGQLPDLLWNVPWVTLVAAARLRHQTPATAPARVSRDEELAGRPARGSPLVLTAFIFPLIHLGFYASGLPAEEARSPRDVVVLICLLVLGALALVEYALLRRTSARAAAERREAERLRVAKEVAERANRAKSAFLANVSHELRTPMSGILGTVDLLRTSGLAPRYDRWVEILKTSAEGLLRIINDILDISKIEAGKLSIETVDFELRATVCQALELPAKSAAAKGIELSSRVAPEVPDALRGDPGRLRQILLNLVSNAVKFTDRGSVSVAVQSVPSGTGSLAIRFAVRDTGIGISSADQIKLFQPFSQVDGSMSRRFGGTGLGLAISKRLVEQMGGQIGVESDPAAGSTFWFVAPFEPRSATDQQAPVASAGSGVIASSHLRILIAEDDPTNRLVAIDQLFDLGYRADAAGNGCEALEALSRERYDLVLMDCQMPELDGYETTRRIRQAESEGEHIPVIAVTAHALKGERERCLAVGMDDFLAKPYTREDLVSTLARWLPED